jgi:hypothetical protein
VFAAVALIMAYVTRDLAIALVAFLAIASAFVGLSLIAPSVLRPLNIAWMRFARLLAAVVNPVVMLLLFAVAIVPAGLLMQLVRDPLRRRRGADSTYWIPVEPNAASSMKNQF